MKFIQVHMNLNSFSSWTNLENIGLKWNKFK